MILFNADLDNTLIYSYKCDIGEEKRCVEIYQGREIAYMTQHSYDLLHKVNQKVCVVPTTTRTKEQYQRINLGIGVPKYALVCNGGELLVDGVSDLTWYQETRKIIKDCDDTMKQAIELLQCDPHRTFEIRYIDQLFIFTKSDDPDESIKYLTKKLDTAQVDVFKTGIKVYVIPKLLTKGNAILRLKERLHPKMVIAAGDSEFDLSMIEVADLSFVPNELATRYEFMGKQESIKDEGLIKIAELKYNKHPRTIINKSGLFSETILRYIDKNIKEI